MLRVRVPPEPSITPSWSSLECSPRLSARRSRVQIPSGALKSEGRHGTQTGKAARLKPGDSVGSTPTRATRGWFLGWCSSRRPVKPLPSSCEAEGGRFDSFTTHWRFSTKVRSSIGTGHQPLKLERRVRFPHGPLDDSPGGGTGRRAGLRSTCPRGVGVRISPRRLIDRDFPGEAGARSGLHKADLPGSIPGPGTAGGPVLGRVSYARRRRFDSPTRNCRCSMARYANWHRGQVESLVPVGSTPTRATDRNSSRRLAAKTPVLQTG